MDLAVDKRSLYLYFTLMMGWRLWAKEVCKRPKHQTNLLKDIVYKTISCNTRNCQYNLYHANNSLFNNYISLLLFLWLWQSCNLWP